MLRCAVCKTIVAWPNKPRFILQNGADLHQLRSFPSLAELASDMRRAAPKSFPPQTPRRIRNEVPGDIVWAPHTGDQVTGDDVAELTRLSRDEVRELARLLRK